MRSIKKFLSRKFLLTLLASVFSAVMAFSGKGGEIGSICSLICAFVAPVCYVITEGKIDSKALNLMSEAAKKASETLDFDSADK